MWVHVQARAFLRDLLCTLSVHACVCEFQLPVTVCGVCVRAVGVGLSRAHALPSAGVKHSLDSSLGKHSIM